MCAVAAAKSRRAQIRRAISYVFTRDVSIPVAAEWKVSADYILPKDFSVSAFAGLIQCQVLRSSHPRLLTFWKSGDHLRTQSPAFSKAVGVADRIWDGEIADVRQTRASYLPTSLFDGLVKASAIIGAATVVYQAYSRLLAPAEVSVEIAAIQPLDASPNSSIRIPLSITNHSTSADARVELSDFRASVADSGIDYGPRLFPLDPGERTDATLTAHTGKAGDIRVVLNARATSGWWRRQQVTPVTVDLKIWPAQQRTDFYAVESECASERCVMRSDLLIGQNEPTGLDCWARVVGVPDVRMLWVSTASDGGGEPVEAGEGSARLVKIEWHQQRSEPFRRHRVDIVMAGRIPYTQWKTIASDIVWLCASTANAGGQ
jgi:hypothetical protein